MIDKVRNNVRSFMRIIAVALNNVSGGKLHPNSVTIIGLLLHVVIAWAIINESFVAAGLMLIVFGLLDTLDGELARLQKRASAAGMLLDATTDRMKEALLYTAIAYYFAVNYDELGVAWTVAALGGSFLVSYSKAKGETALSEVRKDLSANELNRVFSDGFMRFELRMLALVIGLLTGYLFEAVLLVAVGSWLTATWRIANISRELNK